MTCLSIVSLCLILLFSTNCRARTHVIIINDLGEGVKLDVHCKSKQDDLGMHQLAYKDLYDFSFNSNAVWAVTLFYCSFEWNNKLRWFNVYDQNIDAQVCHDKCYWNVYEDGPCLIIPPTRWVSRCKDWKGNSRPG